MSDQEYEDIEKIFGGSWRVDRDENLEDFMTAADMPEKTRELFRQLLHQHAVFQLKRYGSAFVHSIAIAGHVFETKMVLNEAFDWKERADNPDYDNTLLVTFKDNVVTFDVTPKMADGGKRHLFKFSVKEDELVSVLSLPDEPSITATRIYTKC